MKNKYDPKDDQDLERDIVEDAASSRRAVIGATIYLVLIIVLATTLTYTCN